MSKQEEGVQELSLWEMKAQEVSQGEGGAQEASLWEGGAQEVSKCEGGTQEVSQWEQGKVVKTQRINEQVGRRAQKARASEEQLHDNLDGEGEKVM